MSQTFQINDRVKVTNTKSPYFYFYGTVADYQPFNLKEFQVDFDQGGSSWFEDHELTYVYQTNFTSSNANLSNSIFGSQGFTDDLKSIWKGSNYSNNRCFHKWKPTVLIYTTVYDCEICKMKKEDYDNTQDDGVPF